MLLHYMHYKNKLLKLLPLVCIFTILYTLILHAQCCIWSYTIGVIAR